MSMTLRENLQMHIYKRARIEKQYHLTPATTDKGYGPEVITPTNSSQEELRNICNEYL